MKNAATAWRVISSGGRSKSSTPNCVALLSVRGVRPGLASARPLAAEEAVDDCAELGVQPAVWLLVSSTPELPVCGC